MEQMHCNSPHGLLQGALRRWHSTHAYAGCLLNERGCNCPVPQDNKVLPSDVDQDRANKEGEPVLAGP